MADVKISALPAATTPLAGTEVLPIVQSGATRRVAVSDLTSGRDVAMKDLTTTGNTILGDAQADTLNVGNGDIVKTSAGLVGIGTAAPVGKLDVRTTTGAIVLAGRTANVGVGSEAGYFQTRAPNDGGSARIWSEIKTVISNATSPNEANSLVFSTQSAGALAEDFRIDPNRYMLVGYTTSNGAYRLQVNGQIFATSATIATSDARYKENIQDLTGALDIVAALRPVQFNWKHHASHNFNTEVPTIGFLAQEVQQVLANKPYLNSLVKSSMCEIEPAKYKETVTTNEAGDEVTTVEMIQPAVTEDFLGIAEGNMIAILTKAIQELKAEFDAYKASHS